jgi:hypothetical protein
VVQISNHSTLAPTALRWHGEGDADDPHRGFPSKFGESSNPKNGRFAYWSYAMSQTMPQDQNAFDPHTNLLRFEGEVYKRFSGKVIGDPNSATVIRDGIPCFYRVGPDGQLAKTEEIGELAACLEAECGRLSNLRQRNRLLR